MKRQQGKYIPDFWRRRHYLLFMVTQENASNLSRFSDALSLISKVFGLNKATSAREYFMQTVKDCYAL